METEAAQKLKILLVEDDLIDRKLLQRLLSQSALSISDIKPADCLRTALEFLEKDHFDVVFLDLGLPDSQGIDTFTAIYDRAEDIPIIVLSGLDDEKMAVTAVKKGVQDYFVKGQIDSNLLTRAVRYAIERKRISKILDEKQKNIEAIFDAAPIGMMLIDEHTVVKRVNDAVRQLLNKDYRQIINQRFGDALGCVNAANSGKGCGNSSACETCLLHKAISTVLDLQQSVHEVEVQLALKIDDKQFTHWLLVSGVPATIDGHLHAVFAVNDITKSKLAERDCQLAEDRYRTIFENSAVSISLVDEQERLISWNKFTESLLGMNKEDLYLKPVKSLYPEGQWHKIRALNVRQKGLQRHLESEMIRKDGSLIAVDVSLSVLKNPEGKVIGSIGVVADITERKRAEEELKSTMEAKSQFISTVSHELRTPLASMKEAISIVLDGIAGKINKDQKRFLDIAQRNINRLARLINEVLDFQKLNANKTKLNIQPNDIAEAVRDACHTMTLYAQKKKVKLSINLDDDLPKASFDVDAIVQVLTNLISNSIKFTPENGVVSVSAQQKEGDLVIHVSDTGIGVNKEFLTKIFDPFYQVHPPGQESKGTGLGLSIVNKIVMMHGGRIEVESEVNQGTTFSVFLPLDSKAKPEVLPEETDEFLENTVVDSQVRTA
ncbi:MAG: PAS domain S-box protein [Phycisphaerae bacterium]|nr:PAS domain S-box protein [Phycisphaerae bacterium]